MQSEGGRGTPQPLLYKQGMQSGRGGRHSTSPAIQVGDAEWGGGGGGGEGHSMSPTIQVGDAE